MTKTIPTKTKEFRKKRKRLTESIMLQKIMKVHLKKMVRAAALKASSDNCSATQKSEMKRNNLLIKKARLISKV